MSMSVRILVAVLVVLGAMTGAWAQGQDSIEIKFKRPEAVGSKLLVETSFTSEIAFTVDDLTAPDVIEDIKKYEKVKGAYRLAVKRTGVAVRKVEEVDKDGVPSTILVGLKQIAEKIGKQKEEKTWFDKENPVTITGTLKSWGATAFSGMPVHGMGGKNEEDGAREVMSQVCLGIDSYDFDSVYGTTGKRTPGETWPVNAPALMAVLEGSKWRPTGSTDISGTVTFLRYGAQNKKQCAILEAVTVINNVPSNLIVPEKGQAIDRMEVTMTVRVALPTDMKSPCTVVSSVMKGRLNLPAVTGRNAVTLEVTEARGEDKTKTVEDKK
jgi:hypothetical protein